MGQLLFCSHALAKKPYDIESASLNIYSLEEMSYYLTVSYTHLKRKEF